ncbi:MAG TPA: TlpA disulfide reductase family protein [Cyclobacteriaceae bacterium]|nr:TlpA disulfide reductase family protein [Cyclobacteriaceae bacterium]
MNTFIRNRRREFVVSSILFCLILAGQAYCQQGEMIDPDIHPLINQLSPEIKGKTLSGKTFDLTDYRGKILLINIWGLRCPPCYEEIMELNLLGEAYKKEDVIIISLLADSRSDVLKKVKSFGIFYKFYEPQAGNENIGFEIIPDAQQIISKFDVEGVPMNFVVNQKGIVKGFSNGYRRLYSFDNRNVVAQESENYKVLAKKIEDVIVGDKANR